MRMPGFTADDSLYKTSASYYITVTSNALEGNLGGLSQLIKTPELGVPCNSSRTCMGYDALGNCMPTGALAKTGLSVLWPELVQAQPPTCPDNTYYCRPKNRCCGPFNVLCCSDPNCPPGLSDCGEVCC